MIRGGRLASHFASLREEEGLTASMFRQDVPLGVTPLSIRRSDKYKATLLGEDQEREKALAVLRSVQEYEHADLNELVATAVHDIAQSLAWYGRSTYEIIVSSKASLHTTLHEITPKRLFRFRWVYVQIVPKADRRYWGDAILRTAPARSVWQISMPAELGGFRGYRRLLRRLRIGNRLAPAFWQRDLELGSVTRSFNFSEYRRQTEIFEARATREWGWPRRDYSGSNWTEFALFYRLIKFHWAQAKLREHIIAELNKLFVRLSIRAEISVSGLPTATEILGFRRQMAEGRLTFAKASEASSVH
jgi:hypothetical protein